MNTHDNNFVFETAFHNQFGQQAGKFLDSLLAMSSRRAIGLLCAAMTLTLLLTGCGVTGGSTPILSSSTTGESIQGRVQGGQTPVVGTHVYLFAANTTGYGSPSVSLLQASSTGHTDSLGAYVLTDSTGAFTIDGDYTCKPDTQVYLYGVGGNPGAGTNSAAGFLAILGNCPRETTFSSASPAWMNEITTVAAAYAFAGYATDATHVSSSGTPLAQTGIQNAFASASNLVDPSTGTARSTTPAGNGTINAATINTLANILATCVNSTGPNSPQCTTLFSATTSDGTSSGLIPTETATAALNIAHHPAVNVAQIYSVANSTPIAIGGGLTSTPTDFNLSISYTNDGLYIASQPAIDAKGNVWIADSNGPNGNGGLVELNSLGAPVSPASGWTDGSLNNPGGLAIDATGNVWLANFSGHNLTEFSHSGSFQATASAPGNALLYPKYFGFDQTGNLWVASSDSMTNSLMKFSGSGAYQATYTGNGLGQSNGLSIDRYGDVWLSQNAGISEFTNSGTPAKGSPFVSGSASAEGLAFDFSNRLWVLNTDSSVSVLDTTGNYLGGFPYANGTASGAEMQAIDGVGSDWIVLAGQGFPATTGNLVGLSGSGNLLTSVSGYSFNTSGYNVGGLAIDGSGNVWVTGGNQVTEFLGAAAPVVTPLAANLGNPYIETASRP
jgi:hypothetical protein